MPVCHARVPPGGIEPPANSLGNCCSIQLSYGGSTQKSTPPRPSAGTSTPLGQWGLTIHYAATASDGGTWTGLVYTTDAGDVTVTSPALPWEIDVTNATAPARIQRVGSVTGSGGATISYSANGGEGRTESDEVGCNLNN